MKKILKWIGISSGSFFLIVLTILILDISNDDTTKVVKVVKEEFYPAQEISCNDGSLKEDIICIFNQAFADLKSKNEAVTDHYFVEKYNQTSVKVHVKDGIDQKEIFPHFRNAMKTAVNEKELKEFTVEFLDENDEIVDSYSFIGENNLKDYNWDDVEWKEVSVFAPKN
jgi:hypothetical protein